MTGGKKVAVLQGGFGAERGISMVSGGAAAKALRVEGYDVEEIDVTRSLAQDIAASFGGEGPDVVFNALHGPYGEDGTVQGLLEIMGLPYTHSGVLASAICMDKPRAKVMMRAAGLRVPDGEVLPLDAFDGTHKMAPPYVFKPVGDGSSFGVQIVLGQQDPAPRADILDRPLFGGVAMIEAYIPGRELTVTCLNEDPLAVTEIVPHAGFYDYHAKYQPEGSSHVVPAELPADIYEEAMKMAAAAVRATGAKGMSRTDLRWDDGDGVNGLFILEINTQPGLTPTSLAPEQAALKGMAFGALMRWMVEDASCPR
jgi:D-alanine-D-alanine ligase